MLRASTIELFKEDMKFSSGHFTIFSKEVRENLHGHNYNLYATFTTLIGKEGLAFDYRFYKKKLRDICQELDEIVLIPKLNPYVTITDHNCYYHLHFNEETMIFLKRDVKILPLTNVTVEELSNWILQRVLQDTEELARNKIEKIKIKVFSGPGQSGSTLWRNNKQ